MFKKILSNFSSSIQIDTRIFNPVIRQGEFLEGEVYVKAEKDIRLFNIKLVIHATYRDEDGYKNIVYHTHTITDSYDLHKGEQITVPFGFDFPADSPISSYNTKIFIKTEADTSGEGLFEKTDKDYLEVLPQPTFAMILDIVEQKGFKLTETEIDVDKYGYGHGRKRMIVGRNFVQELDYKPGHFSQGRRRIEEFEISLLDSDFNGNILIQFSIEKHARKLTEFMGYNPDTYLYYEVAANQDYHYYENIVNEAMTKFIY